VNTSDVVFEDKGHAEMAEEKSSVSKALKKKLRSLGSAGTPKVYAS
jgi:hypothetical protein